MRKWFTLVFVVNEYSSGAPAYTEDAGLNLLTNPDEGQLFSPSDAAVKNIMDFARSYEVLESESAGQIELVIN